MFSLCTGISLYLPIIWLFPYIFLLFDCFEWALIDCIEKWRVHSELWQFQMGGEGGREGSSILLFPYIFLLFDCLRMGAHWLHWKAKSSLWALAVSNGGGGREGGFISFTVSLYLPIIWLFRMGVHWLHWKAKSSLWALAVSNGGGGREGDFISFTQVNLKIWAPGCLGVLINKVFSLYAKTKNTSERMHIHLLRVSSESETVRKFVACIASPLKSNRTKWHPHNLKFCTNFRKLLLYSRSFNNFC